MAFIDIDGLNSFDQALARVSEMRNRAASASEISDSEADPLLESLKRRCPRTLVEHPHAADSLDYENQHTQAIFVGNKIVGYIISGTKPHEIKPRYKKALHWIDHTGADRFARRVSHPGTHANDFRPDALRDAHQAMLTAFVERVRQEILGG